MKKKIVIKISSDKLKKKILNKALEEIAGLLNVITCCEVNEPEKSVIEGRLKNNIYMCSNYFEASRLIEIVNRRTKNGLSDAQKGLFLKILMPFCVELSRIRY